MRRTGTIALAFTVALVGGLWLSFRPDCALVRAAFEQALYAGASMISPAFAANRRDDAPVAEAGRDRTAALGDRVVLDGSRSVSPTGARLSYNWKVVRLPAGSLAVLDDPEAVMPRLDVDLPGEYMVRLQVSDGRWTSAPDRVTISTENVAPIADAGRDRAVDVGDEVALDATGSTDFDGDSLSYEWNLVETPPGSSAALDDPSTLRPAFFADLEGTYVAEVTVSDGDLTSDPARVVVSTGNLAPVAEAGPAQTAEVDAEVQFDSAGTNDINGDLLSTSWSLLASPSASLSGLEVGSGDRPGLMIDESGTYVTQLKVEDGAGSPVFDTVVISTDNTLPVADAGADQAIALGLRVGLDGTASSDVDGDSLAFRWALISVPEGSDTMLDNPASVDPSFTVDRAGTYVAQLIVEDALGPSLPDTVVLTTENGAPVANARVDQAAGSMLVLDGGDSSDPDGDELTYRWAMLGFGEAGEGDESSLDDPEAVSPSVSWGDGASKLVQLVVNDGYEDSAPFTLFVSSDDSRPIADAGDDLAILPGAVVALDGTGSADLDGDSLTFHWAMLTGPEGGFAALSDPTAMQPTFTADVPGTYVIQLIVNDATLGSLPDTVVVTASGQMPAEVTTEEPPTAHNGSSSDRTPFIVAEATMAPPESSSAYDGDEETPALAMSNALTPLAASASTPAFDDCKGSGCAAAGGRGGAVIEVTNLNNSGTGSLRACIQASGPRTCVFRVGGTINLTSNLAVNNPFLTVAGQTAPGGGILLSGKNLDGSGALMVQMNTHDVIWRYTRFRKGYGSYCVNNPNPGCGGTLQVIGSHDIYNVVWDHNSTSWNTDEGLAAWGNNTTPLRDISFSWNLHGEPLMPHSTSALTGAQSRAIADAMTNIDYHHNLIVSSDYRNPLAKHKSMRFVNNIVYNYRNHASHFVGGTMFDIVNNIYKAGPSTPSSVHEIESLPGGNGESPTGNPSLYVVGNIGPHNSNPDADNWAPMVRQISGSENGSEVGSLSTAYRRTTPLPAAVRPITTTPVGQLPGVLLQTVGASQRLTCSGTWVANRDSVDTRLISDYNNGTGAIRSNESQVGGFPTIANGTPCADADHDGMPDVWETANGLDPNGAADRNGDLDADGYTNLEEFLNARSAGEGPAPPPTASLSADPPSIAAGESSTLSWSSTDATSCTGTGTNFSTGGAVSGSESVSPSVDTTYTLECTGPGGSVSDSALVAVTAPAPGPAPADFPVTMTGSTPEEASVTIEVAKPADANEATLSLVVNDADFADEGELFINDNGPIALFGDQLGADGATVTTTFTTPASWWTDGANTLRFRHTSTNGYRIDSAQVSFAANGGTTACAATVLNVHAARSDGGFAWLVGGDYGTPADNSSNFTRSTLRLFEDGVELDPPHSPHRDIRDLGRGRFSHWSNVDGTGESLRFASSDNSNPRGNGRTYEVCTGGSTTTAAR